MMQKRFLIFSVVLNVLLLTLIFQFKDKILPRIFPPKKTAILMIGDSRIAQENWSILLSRNDVKNEAFGGAITQQMLWNLERGQLNSEPELVVLEVGINDLLAGVPPQRVYENYLKMIEIFRAKKIDVIINSIIYTADNQVINSYVLDLNSRLKNFCTTHKIVWLDVNEQLSQDEKLLEKYSSDSIHLNKAAYQIWAGKLNEKLLQFSSL